MTIFDNVRINKKTRRKNDYERSLWRRSVIRKPVAGNDKYVKIAMILEHIFIGCGIPEYLHSKSNRVFSQHQRIAMLVLCEFIGKSQRDFCEILPTYRGFCDVLGIVNIPHHTTVCKFAKLVRKDDLLKIVGYFGTLCASGLVLAVDGTALSDHDRSGHYERRLNDFGKTVTRTFTKVSLAADTDTLLVLACEVSEGHVHDMMHVDSLLDQLVDADLDVDYLVADKGYDSEPFHKNVKARLKAKAIIPARKNTPKRCTEMYRTTGKHRSEMKRTLFKCTIVQWIYQLRPLIECINSMIKRKLGSHMRAKSPESRVNRAICKIIAHNINRVLDLKLVRSILEV